MPRSSPADRAVRDAVREACASTSRLQDPLAQISAASVLMAALEEETVQLAQLRIAAVLELRRSGWSLGRIADATGLSKARIAQIARDARGQ